MIYFIDTNIFLRILTKDNQQMFDDCFQFLTLVKTHKIDAVTCSLVKSEIAWTLKATYGLSKYQIIDSMNHLENFTTLISINFYADTIAMKLFTKFPVKYVDAQIASIPEIRKKEWTIVSYDKDFDKLGVKRLEPSQVVKKFSK